ncbi:MAG: hypothetical protein NT142_03970 [Planctomycetota bacterium]|nr:hypothetical protein [Planctomycetota bacterium]
MPDSKKPWVNHNFGYPKIVETLEISVSRYGIFIGGDPSGLLSLSKLLEWVAKIDQENLENIPTGQRFHIHLHSNELVKEFNSLNRFSKETQICRLDAKGTGELPKKYNKLK